MEHHFNVELAEKYGIEESILLNHLFFWIRKNVANGKYFYDGRFWTYNTAKAYAKLFPYMNETKIYRIINHLCEANLIQKGKYNEDKSVHINWYAFTDNGLAIMYKNGYDTIGMSNTFQNDDILFTNLQKGICKNEKSILINYTDRNTYNDKEKEIDKSISTKKDKDELFEKCWIAYNRKGSKKQAKMQWDKLDDAEKALIMPHIKAYVSSRELNYQKDFERYIRDKTFLSIVLKGNQVIYDPAKKDTKDYMPQTSPLLAWNDYYNCYIYLGFWDGHIADGYSDDDRPDGAEVTLNNGRGIVKWNSLTKKWNKNG